MCQLCRQGASQPTAVPQATFELCGPGALPWYDGQMTERTIRKRLAAYLEQLDHRADPAEGKGSGRLRKVLLPAALGVSMLLTAGCNDEGPLPAYMGPPIDGFTQDVRKDGPPDQGSEVAPDQGAADVGADAAQDAGSQADSGRQAD